MSAETDQDKTRTFRDDARSRCPECGSPAVHVCAGEKGQIARCAAGHEWQPEALSVRLGKTKA